MLETSTDLETIYSKAALRDNTAPSSAQDEVDLHYVCFIKSSDDSIYEMNGDANEPVKTDVTLEVNQDLLKASALECVRRCIARNEGDINFSLLALVYNISDTH